MSISTRTGDTGQTGLVGGRRVSKADPRVEAYGTVDELVSQIGLARALAGHHEEASALAKAIQRDLFALADALASAEEPAKPMDGARIQDLTEHVHRIERQDGILIDWAIPGDHAGAAAFDVARTTCRRAERTLVRLRDSGEPVHLSLIAYLNRLADLLWLLGRLIERDSGVDASLRRADHAGARWSKAWP
jgi:cob(I)alamin adenosyltransferase